MLNISYFHFISFQFLSLCLVCGRRVHVCVREYLFGEFSRIFVVEVKRSLIYIFAWNLFPVLRSHIIFTTYSSSAGSFSTPPLTTHILPISYFPFRSCFLLELGSSPSPPPLPSSSSSAVAAAAAASRTVFNFCKL